MPISIGRFFRRLRSLLCFHSNAEKDDDSIVGDASVEHGVNFTEKLSETILASIFTQCVALSYHPSSPFVSIYPSATPLGLSHVSKRWRKVALSVREIWSSIYVMNNTRQEILLLWLDRAGPLSDLNLRIQAVHLLEDLTAEPDDGELNPPTRNFRLRTSTDLGRAWSILVSHVHRWRRIDIELDMQTVFDFLELPLTNALRLNNLSLTVVVRDAQELPTKVLDYLQTTIKSPTFKVQRLTWECIPVERMTTHSLWGSLREIHLSMGVTMDQAVKFLRSCIRAEDVALACITTDCVTIKEYEFQLEAAYRELMPSGLGTFPSPQRHTLPNLRKLSIGMGGVVCDCIPIVQFFILPALTHLEVQCFDTGKQSWELLEGFFRRSAQSAERQWNIQKLTFVDHNMAQWHVEKLLSAPGIPVISCYTRRSIDVQEMSGRLGGSMELIAFEDSWRGTWIEYSNAIRRQ